MGCLEGDEVVDLLVGLGRSVEVEEEVLCRFCG